MIAFFSCESDELRTDKVCTGNACRRLRSCDAMSSCSCPSPWARPCPSRFAPVTVCISDLDGLVHSCELGRTCIALGVRPLRLPHYRSCSGETLEPARPYTMSPRVDRGGWMHGPDHVDPGSHGSEREASLGWRTEVQDIGSMCWYWWRRRGRDLET